MDLMHEATLAGIDPDKTFDGGPYEEARRALASQRTRRDERDRARAMLAGEAKARADHDRLRAAFLALPESHRRMYRRVRDGYAELADAWDDAIIENLRKTARAAVKRAEREHAAELRRIADEGLTGEDRDARTQAAGEALARARARAGWALNTRVIGLRAQFESNRLQGPYFPLAHFGNYFLTLIRYTVVSSSALLFSIGQPALRRPVSAARTEWLCRPVARQRTARFAPLGEASRA